MNSKSKEIDVTAILKDEMRSKYTKILQVRKNIERDYKSILDEQFFVTVYTLTLFENEIANLNRKAKLLESEWENTFGEEFKIEDKSKEK